MAREMDRYEIKLAFTADNRQAISQIQQLDRALNNITKIQGDAYSPIASSDLEKAVTAADELRIHLKEALNQKTGKLDLSKFLTSLKASNQDLSYFQSALAKTGQIGKDAFFQLAQTLAYADAGVFSISNKLSGFLTTLKNTAKWQLSSNITHGLERAISSAYGYAKNLNSSLNDIRIVTGHSVEYMDQFAKKANEAARALSSTTLNYTNSALTYYQQGLDDKQVEARTAITLKMANASGVAAETVAEQLTAVWNNFSKGTDDLEHFADVMVRLGADTASSTDEISDGLQKFSAIANTIGLSFDNAAAALATITATTRESADTVGTALRTLFARIQGLNLGETLDDGTTLNKYSEALNKVGINIKDQSGNLKEMDTILDEMGARWKTLANDEQVALAQVVGGVRQYQYVMNLMNNFDFYQENVSRAQNADGSLQEQADIYAEGWEAARNRVKTALQDVYDSLIDDEFFIKVDDVLVTILESVKGLTDAFGGLGGIIKFAFGLLLTYSAKEMPRTLERLKTNMMFLFGQGPKTMSEATQKANQELNKIISSPRSSLVDKTKAEGIQQVLNMRENLIRNNNRLSASEKQLYEMRIQHIQSINEEQVATAKLIQEQEKELASDAEDIVSDSWIDFGAQRNWSKGLDTQVANGNQNAMLEKNLQVRSERAAFIRESFKLGAEMSDSQIYQMDANTFSRGYQTALNTLKELTLTSETYSQILSNIDAYIIDLQDDMEGVSRYGVKSFGDLKNQAIEYFNSLKKNKHIEIPGMEDLETMLNTTTNKEGLLNWFQTLYEEMDKTGTEADETLNKFKKLLETNIGSDNGFLNDYTRQVRDLAKSYVELGFSQSNAEVMAGKLIQHNYKLSESITAIAGAAMSLQTAFNAFQSLYSAIKSFNDASADTTQIIGSLIGGITSLVFALQSIRKIKWFESLQGKLFGLFSKTATAAPGAAAGITAVGGATQTAGVSAGVAAGGFKALAATLGTFAIFIAIFAGLSLAISAIRKHIQKIKENSPEGQLKKAREETEKLNTALENTKSQVEELTSAFDKYDEVKNKITDCVKGTKEWEEALDALNKQVLEILTKYPELVKYVERDPLTGELGFSNNYEKYIRDQANLQQLIAYKAYQDSIVNTQQKEFGVSSDGFKEQLYNNLADYWETLNTTINPVTGERAENNQVIYGDEIAQIFANELDRVILENAKTLEGMTSEEISAFLQTYPSLKQFFEEKNSPDYVADFVKRDNENFNQGISELLKKSIDYIQQATKDAGDIASTQQVYNEEAVRAVLNNNENYSEQDSEMQGYLRRAANNFYNSIQEEQDKHFKEVVNQTTEDSELKNLLDNYIKRYNVEDGTWDTEKGYVDKDGKVLISKDTLATFGAIEKTFNLVNTQINELIPNFQRLRDSTDPLSKALLDFQSSESFEWSTQAQVEAIKNSNENQVKAMWGVTDEKANEIAAKNGYETWTTYVAAMKEQAEKTNFSPIETFFRSNGIDSKNIDYITGQTILKFKNSLSDEGKIAFNNVIGDISKSISWDKLDESQIQDFWQRIGQVSWEDWDSKEQLEKILEDTGEAFNGLANDWENTIQKLRASLEIDLGLDKLRETLESIDKIVKDIKIGSIIDNESYTTLMAFNKELEKYFTMLSDGSAQFTGSIFDFNSDYEDAKITEYEDRIKVVNQQIDKIKQDERLYEAGLATGRTEKNTNQPDSDKLNQKTGESQLAQNELALMVQDTDRAEELYRQGILNYTAMSERANAKQNELYASNLDASEVEQYSDYLQDLADSEKDVYINGARLSKELKNNDSAARKVAASAKLTQKGIDSLASGLEDWKELLKDAEKGTTTYAYAIGELKTAASQLLNVNEDFISDDFLVSPENMANFEKAAKGDTDAIWALREALARDFILNLDIDEESKNNFLTSLNALLEDIPTIDIGVEINDEKFKTKIGNILQESKMTAEQANAFLSTMGLHMEVPKVEAGYVETKDELMNTITDTQTIDMGNGYVSGSDGGDIKDGSHRYAPPIIRTVSTSWQEPSGKYRTTRIPVYMKDGKPNFKLTRTDGGTLAGPSTSGPKGGKSSKPSKTSKTKKSDTVERYKEITDKINNLTRAYDNAAKAADRLYGKDRVKAMEENNKRLKQEIELLKQKAKEAKDYLVNEDRPALDKAAAALGVNFKIDNNNIVNYHQEMEKIYKTLTQMEDKVNAFKNADAQSKYKENTYEPYKEKVDELKAAIGQWEETRDLILDLQDEQMEKFYEWQDQNLEVLNYKLEVKITINENDLKWLEHYFKALSDNIYKAAEAFGYLQTQVEPNEKMLAAQKETVEELDRALAAGEISIAGYVESMQDAYNSILSNIEALQDLDKQMVEYYGNTLDLAEEELSKYTDQMEHLTNMLDHYKSIMQLLGKETDYDSMGVLLGGVANTKRNNYLVSKEWFQTLKAQQVEAAAALANAGSELEREALQKNFDAISEKVREAEEQMLSDAEEYGQAIQEIWVNKTTQAADLMNKALTNGMGWDALNDSMSRMSSYQDEYLTKTNQVYEMNKLLNTVSQAIDKTNNQAAKNRYNQFAKEIEQLKDKDKLSQLELEIAQAKYKILEAQIALEEAQNAKSIVRLQRDSEGNFGYVYTADQDKINNAEQQLADAENDLYNIRLNATNKYGQQKLKYEQELAEKLAEVDQRANEDAIYREGEYQNERKRIQEEYQALINASNELYKIGQQEDARVVQDAWVNSYDYIIDKGDEWQGAIKDYTDSVNEAFREWEANTDILTDLVGKDLDEVTDKVGDVVWASEQLRDKVVDDIIPGLEVELTAVRSLTEGWAQHRDELYENIRAYEELAKYAMDQIAEKSGYSGFDMDADYSTLMANSIYGSREYEQYKAYRQQKLNKMEAMGMDTSTMASNEQLDDLFALSARESGWKLGSDALANYSSYNEIPDYIWDLITQMLARKMSGFASGGYTGEWDGDNGKLAILHQKELVLNANDTNNLLNAVSIIRSIGTVIDRMAAFSGLSSLVSAAPQGMSAQGLDQSVVINAEFPNATDRNEIAEAFNSLINRASQFANRKNI